MAHIGKAFLVCQIHLTAFMTLVAGMPHFVCRCPGLPAYHEPQQAAQTATCCCCGSCGTISDKPSCCHQKSPGSSKGPSRSQGAGNDCTQVTGLPKEPAISTTKSVKLIDVFSGFWAASLAVSPFGLHPEPQDSLARWTGHSPAPPADRVISLQRLLI